MNSKCAVFLFLVLFCCCPRLEATTLTANEDKVKPYLLDDVKHYDSWPSNGWELFGLTASEIRSKYNCNSSTAVSYKRTDGGAQLLFNYGQASTAFDLQYDEDGKVCSVTRRIPDLPEQGNKLSLTDRDDALHDALNSANQELARYSNDKEANPGFIWWAYRNRARIYLALGRNLEAKHDIAAAEYYEVQILKNPQKARQDKRAKIVI